MPRSYDLTLDFVFGGGDVAQKAAGSTPSGELVVDGQDFNAICKALADLRGAIGSARFHGLAHDASSAVSPGQHVRLRSNNGVLQVSQDGGAWTPLREVAGSLNLPKTSGVGLKVDSGYAWVDLLGDVSLKATGSGAPTLRVWRGGLALAPFFALNDLVTMAFHIPHDYAPGTDVHLHIHWGHNGTAISGTFEVTFGVTYAKGHDQAIFPAEVSPVLTISTPDIATIPRWRHMLTELQLSAASPSATQLDTDNLEPDGVILCAVQATTLPTITGSALGANGNVPVIFYCDLHYQSTGVGTKQKAPDFYT